MESSPYDNFSDKPAPAEPAPPDALDPAVLARTQRISIAEGALAQAHFAVAAPGSVFLTKFAVLLGATPFQFGLLSAFGQLSLVFQPLGSLLTRRKTSRKGTVLRWASTSRALVFLFGLLPFLMPAREALAAFLALYLLATATQAVSANVWVAWISDMIPREIRGRFFARRAQVLLVAGALTGYLLGGLTDWFQSGAPLPGLGLPRWVSPARLPELFAAIFAFAALIGLIGQLILRRQPERPKAIEPESARELLAAPFRDPNFRRLLLFGCWWNLAVGVGAPFWQPFMIRNLGMSLVEIQIYGTISTVFSLIVLGLWGRFIDRFGNRTAMGVAVAAGGVNPLIWLFIGPDHYGIVYLEAATSGMMWAGAGLVATNFVLALAPEGRRQIYAGLYGAMTGLAIMVTMLLSGVFLPPPLQVGGLMLQSEQVLFGVTGLLRWTALLPLLWIAEPAVPSAAETFMVLRQFAKVRIGFLIDRIVRWR